MNAGRKHSPVGISKRTDSFAARRSMPARAAPSTRSMAAVNRSSGEAPYNHASSNASLTCRQLTPCRRSWPHGTTHASCHGIPRRSPSATPHRSPPNSPPTTLPTSSNAVGIDDPCRITTASIPITAVTEGSSHTASDDPPSGNRSWRRTSSIHAMQPIETAAPHIHHPIVMNPPHPRTRRAATPDQSDSRPLPVPDTPSRRPNRAGTPPDRLPAACPSPP